MIEDAEDLTALGGLHSALVEHVHEIACRA
jgi:hypothetical protein